MDISLLIKKSANQLQNTRLVALITTCGLNPLVNSLNQISTIIVVRSQRYEWFWISITIICYHFDYFEVKVVMFMQKEAEF